MTHNYRIAVVTETFAPEINGVANSLRYLTEGLLARGHQLQIIRPRQTQAASHSPSSLAEQVLTRGLPIPGYQGLRFGLPCARRLRKMWKNNPPDAIYIATEGPLGFSACAVARQFGIPVLSGFHTNFHQYSQHYHLGWLTPLITAYLRWFHNHTAATLVPTERACLQLQGMGIRNAIKLGRGVDCTRFDPQFRSDALRRSWGAKPHDPVIISVGRLAAEKNLGLTLNCYERIRATHPRARLVLVGDGPLAPTLKARNHDVIFAGTRTGEDLAQHYASADIFLFPSLTDTFGNVVTEALASGLGVVAFDEAAAGELVQHRVNGMKISFGDSEAFAHAALSLIHQPSALRQIRHEARTTALNTRWPHIVEQLESLFVRLIEGGMRYDNRKAVAALQQS